MSSLNPLRFLQSLCVCYYSWCLETTKETQVKIHYIQPTGHWNIFRYQTVSNPLLEIPSLYEATMGKNTFFCKKKKKKFHKLHRKTVTLPYSIGLGVTILHQKAPALLHHENSNIFQDFIGPPI